MYRPWKVRHVDLSKGLPTLRGSSDIQGIYLVFWWKGIPLGELEITKVQLPLPATQLAERAIKAITPAVGDHLLQRGFKAPLPVREPLSSRDSAADFQTLNALENPLAQLHEQLFSEDVSSSTVSVVVCTRERPHQLRKCLQALDRLSDPPLEIIVVDNAPQSDKTHELVHDQPDVRYVLEPKPGLSVARNTGVRHSEGDIIAFTDDDVTVHPNWTQGLKRAFADPDVLAATGLILPAELETKAQFLFQQGHGDFQWGYRALTFDDRFFDQTRHRGVPVWHIGAGANMAFKREAFERMGLFDERLGAGAAGCSEDSEMWYRIIAEGGVCRYEPTAVVYHRHRPTMEELEHQMFEYMQGHMVALLAQFEKHGHWGNLYRAFAILPYYYSRRLLRSFLKTPTMETIEEQALGCLSGLKYYFQHMNSTNRSPTLTERTAVNQLNHPTFVDGNQ